MATGDFRRALETASRVGCLEFLLESGMLFRRVRPGTYQYDRTLTDEQKIVWGV
jgi:hypothetical protein